MIKQEIKDLAKKLGVNMIEGLPEDALDQQGTILACYCKETGDVHYRPEEELTKNGTDINQVLLHEIMHWTGAPGRLHRPGSDRRLITSEELYTEEITADVSAIAVAKIMGIDFSDIVEHLHIQMITTVLNFIDIDIKHIDNQVKNVVDFVTQKAELKKAA